MTMPPPIRTASGTTVLVCMTQITCVVVGVWAYLVAHHEGAQIAGMLPALAGVLGTMYNALRIDQQRAIIRDQVQTAQTVAQVSLAALPPDDAAHVLETTGVVGEQPPTPGDTPAGSPTSPPRTP